MFGIDCIKTKQTNKQKAMSSPGNHSTPVGRVSLLQALTSPFLILTDHCPSRTQVLCLDRRLHSGVSIYLPADVDQQTGIRRSWSLHCAPQMLLSHLPALSLAHDCECFVDLRLWFLSKSFLPKALTCYSCFLINQTCATLNF